MLFRSISTFEWSTFKTMKHIKFADALVIIIVAGVTVMYDLAIAVAAGVIVSALVFAWKKGKDINITSSIWEDGSKHYEVSGTLFFGSIRNFTDKFDVKGDPDVIYFDFANTRILDHSGIDGINSLTSRYKAKNKVLHLKHLSSDCYSLLKNASEIIDVNIVEDPKYHIADNDLG